VVNTVVGVTDNHFTNKLFHRMNCEPPNPFLLKCLPIQHQSLALMTMLSAFLGPKIKYIQVKFVFIIELRFYSLYYITMTSLICGGGI
jgi:hypothetical protein